MTLSEGSQLRWQQKKPGWEVKGCYLSPPNWRKLMRKLKRKSKCLCSDVSYGSGGHRHSAAFHFDYDLRSYAQNFDRSGSAASSDDSDHFHAFSARFVKPATPPPTATNNGNNSNAVRGVSLAEDANDR